MSMITSFRIWLLKRRLRCAYLSYIHALDWAMDMGCGRHMADQLPSVSIPKGQVNKLAAALCKLDPECELKPLD